MCSAGEKKESADDRRKKCLTSLLQIYQEDRILSSLLCRERTLERGDDTHRLHRAPVGTNKDSCHSMEKRQPIRGSAGH
jgi:hypothetical protein